MVTKDLLEFIKYEKSKGTDEDTIKAELLDNSWVEKDIDEALKKVRSIDPNTPFETQEKNRDKVFVINDEVSHPATVVQEYVEMPVGDKPNVVAGVVSVLFMVISFLFIYKAGMMVAIMSIINKLSYTTGAMYYFLREFPLYGWVILAFAFSASIFLYNSFKIRQSSKFAFTLGALSLLIFPVSLSYINYKLMHSVGLYFSVANIDLGPNTPKIPSGAYTLLTGVFGEPAFLISFITLVILLFSYKKFHFKDKGLSSKNRVYVALFALLFLAPTFFVVLKGYSNAKNDDFGYSHAASKVRYHIYKPEKMPLGLIYSTNFITDKELVGIRDAVQVTYDYALEEIVDIKKSRPVVVKQVGVKPEFSLINYVSNISESYSQKRTVDIPNTVGGIGYLISNSFNLGGSSKTLVFQKNDNVLVSLSTVDSDSQDLIDIALSLE